MMRSVSREESVLGWLSHFKILQSELEKELVR